jgi:hypothetical protein
LMWRSRPATHSRNNYAGTERQNDVGIYGIP